MIWDSLAVTRMAGILPTDVIVWISVCVWIKTILPLNVIFAIRPTVRVFVVVNMASPVYAMDGEALGDTEEDLLGLNEGDQLGLNDGLTLGDTEALGLSEGDSLGDSDAEKLGLKLWLTLGLTDGEKLGDSDGDSLAE